MIKMSSGFTLDGASFAFHCLSPAECSELTVLLLRNNGVLYDATDARKPGFVYVLTSYWADCVCSADLVDVLQRPVTRFWLLETLRLGRWLRPDSHPFFEPPARPWDLWLQYPIGYQDAGQDEVDDDGDVTMQDPTRATRHRVQMPCSPSFLFRGEVPFWPYMTAMLAQPIQDIQELAARLQLITLSDPRRKFNCLEYAVIELLTAEERNKFFTEILPEMVRLVLKMPQMFATPPPLLIPNDTGATEPSNPTSNTRVSTQTHRFTKLEVLTLVCGCFFGVFPDQDIVKRTEADSSPQSKKAKRRGNDNDVIQFPYFTAVRLFSAPGNMGRLVVLKAQKIRCLLQYFLRVIDFANKFAGGGVLNSGCVQEEIRFLLSPELLVSCLVFAKLEPHEAFVIHGTGRYSGYQGYGGSFVYGGNFEDTTSLVPLSNGNSRRECVIAGIDATDYGSARVERQYTRGHVWRDLVKAYAGFAYTDSHDEPNKRCWPVATGNWGCGVFRGDRELKFLIQWLAASLRERELVYVLFERDLDLQAKVDPLLALATSPKACEWDRQSGGVALWLMEFLLNELGAGRGTRGTQSVLTRATSSLRQALSCLQLPDFVSRHALKTLETYNSKRILGSSTNPNRSFQHTKNQARQTPKLQRRSSK
ncbi:Poly(ADP-ribose) glycohydrolase [Phytophthora citrophthora]|uniref:Poly(ADP-ribose) glycohydrolase n=1 Tax=Phytophthora citrophthora TaxID=4793 RepID=A0AAD9GSL4_9STRA|nr:Poly(ADP-ribose) glycohydrolase [Phytophthora citrophthora]